VLYKLRILDAFWVLNHSFHQNWVFLAIWLFKWEAIYEQEAFEKCWAHSPQRAASRQFTRCRHCTVARRLRIDVHDANDDNDNAWQREPLWSHGMGPMNPKRNVLAWVYVLGSIMHWPSTNDGKRTEDDGIGRRSAVDTSERAFSLWRWRARRLKARNVAPSGR